MCKKKIGKQISTLKTNKKLQNPNIAKKINEENKIYSVHSYRTILIVYL